MENIDFTQHANKISRFNSLFWRQLVSFILISTLPLFAVVITEYQKGRESLLENLHYQLQVINEQLMNELEHYFSNIETSMMLQATNAEQLLGHLKQSQLAHQGDTPFTESFSYHLIISQYQGEFLKYAETYDLPGFMVLDDQGDVMYSGGVSSVLLGQNVLADRLLSSDLASSVQKALTTRQSQLTLPEMLTKDEIIPHSRIVYPVITTHGDALGIIVALLPPDRLLNFFSFEEKHVGVKAFLLSDNGDVIYGTDLSAKQRPTLLNNHPKASQTARGDDHHHGMDIVAEYANHQNQLVFGNIHTAMIKNLPVKVVVEILLSEALKPINEFRNRLVALIGIMTMFALVIAYIIALRIISPVKKLTKRVLRVKEGHYDHEEVILNYREVGILSENFEHLVQQTGALLKENEAKNWVQQGQVQLFEDIGGNIEVQTLTEKTLSFFARQIEIKAGAFYVLNDSEKYQLKATYARPKSGLKEQFSMGEGLVGQVALEKEVLEIRGEDEINLLIELSTGSFRPELVIAVPIIHECTTIGVMVFAHTNISQLQKDLLFSCLKTIVMALYSARQREVS